MKYLSPSIHLLGRTLAKDFVSRPPKQAACFYRLIKTFLFNVIISSFSAFRQQKSRTDSEKVQPSWDFVFHISENGPFLISHHIYFGYLIFVFIKMSIHVSCACQVLFSGKKERKFVIVISFDILM